MSVEKPHELQRLFYPKNLAVVGASPNFNGNPRDQGRNYIKGSINQNFKGKIYPVHPTAKDMLGFKTYASVREIPGEVDLAIFTVPAPAVLEVMEDCVEKGVKFVHLFTAGFSETDRKEYIEIEQKLVKMANEGGVRVVGPNCMGLYCPEGGLAFQPSFPHAPGSTGFLSQSGQMADVFIHKAAAKGLSFSKVISFGNASDLSAPDFLDYLYHDPKTKVIGSYMEDLKSGRRFFEAAKTVTRKKPLVIYKGGRTKGGSRAAKSHTAAIAGSIKIWEAFCKQTGIISVKSMDELVYTLSAVQKMSLPDGKNVAIVGGAGGGSVTMTDIVEAEGLLVPRLSDNTITQLEKIIPPQGTSVKNPLDIGMAGFMNDNFSKIIDLLRDDPKVDALIFRQQIASAYKFAGKALFNQLIDMTLKAKDRLKKPMIIVVDNDRAFGGENIVKMTEERYDDENLVVFPSVELAAKVIKNLSDYNTYLSKSH